MCAAIYGEYRLKEKQRQLVENKETFERPEETPDILYNIHPVISMSTSSIPCHPVTKLSLLPHAVSFSLWVRPANESVRLSSVDQILVCFPHFASFPGKERMPLPLKMHGGNEVRREETKK